MEELKGKYYNEGVFPEGTLKRIELHRNMMGTESPSLHRAAHSFYRKKN